MSRLASLDPCTVTSLSFIFAFLSQWLMTLTLAQSFHPLPLYGVYYSSIEGKAFYIGGGKSSGVSTPTTFSIDLSKPWSASNPPYSQMIDSFNAISLPSAVSGDGTRWVVAFEGVVYDYIFDTRPSWKASFEAVGSDFAGSSMVSDPETGTIYIPNGFPGFMLTGNLTSQTFGRVEMPASLVGSISFGLAWSAALKKLVLIGGSRVGQPAGLNAFSYGVDGTGIGKWDNLTMKGQVPSACTDACLMPAYGGSKLILFGGTNPVDNSILPSIYVLDVATMTWTKGPDVAAKDKRSEMACAVSGDYFITWGGGGVSGATFNSTLLYSIKTNKWTPSYIPPPVTATTSVPTLSPTSPGTPSGNESGKSSSNNTTRIAIIAIASVLGVVAVALVAIGGFLYRLRRKRVQNIIQNSALGPQVPPTSGGVNNNPSPSKGKPGRNPHCTPVMGEFASEESAYRNPQHVSQPHAVLLNARSPQCHAMDSYPLPPTGCSFNAPQEGTHGAEWVPMSPHTVAPESDWIQTPSSELALISDFHREYLGPNGHSY
ncbi:hypothetical protein B0O80DRAFT_434770 [Mortierella sp. GBAus27b]|nr:hypothetical protein B0O80DRAFT_434770 [Mortierella sp. GBAus27b]